jgi:hypothetical protein
MNAAVRLRNRIEVSSVTALVAAADAVAIGVFIIAGEISHGVDILGNPMWVLDTAAPFYIGWVLVAALAGLFTQDAVRSVRRAVLQAWPAWVVAVLVAQGLRATSLFHGNAALTFALVSILVGGGLVVAGRAAVAAVTAREV